MTEVHVLMLSYDEDYGHPFRDADRLTYLVDVYANKEDANQARERLQKANDEQRLKKNAHYSVVSRTLRGMFPKGSEILVKISG